MDNFEIDDCNAERPAQLYSMEKLCGSGENVFVQGEETREMYILLDGRVSVTVDGMELAVIEEQGSYFGEMAKLLDLPRTATVKTLTPCRLLVIQEDVVEEFLAHSPNLGFKLAKILAARLKETTNDLVEMSQLVSMGHKVSGKVYAKLREYKEQSSGVKRVYGEVHKALRQYGEKSKKAVVSVTRKGTPAEPAAKDRQSTYTEKYSCFFHPPAQVINCHSLKFKTQIVHPNAFDVMVYKAAVPEQDYCNYMLIEVQICPECYFATNYFKHFYPVGTEGVMPREFKNRIIAQVQAQKAEREAIFKKMSGAPADSLLRTHEDAILAFELAAASYKAIAMAHKEPHGMSLYRVGNFYLKAAHLCSELGDLVREEDYLQLAIGYLEKSYATLSGPCLYRVSLQILALYIYFEDFQHAAQYLQAMNKISATTVVNEQQMKVLMKYLDMIRDYWQDRENRTRSNLTRSML
ncbi:MAG: DUF2225 domain-containing protein [Desulfobulbaceae bacterium]|nr:DUF2225 domain-containing protein [Desulfobulbaceae bacterium]